MFFFFNTDITLEVRIGMLAQPRNKEGWSLLLRYEVGSCTCICWGFFVVDPLIDDSKVTF